MLDALRDQVYEANLEIVREGLVVYTWGNVSGRDPETGLVAIKPSGVDYDTMTPEDMVIVDLEGNVVEGARRPSSDTATHLELYRRFEGVGGVVHTHSTYATVWAQAGRDLPCLGTTHADTFYGSVPCTAPMTPEEIAEGYEHNTGVVIVRRFEGLSPKQIPAVLVHGHGPFAWGVDAFDAVHNAVTLEYCARMALLTNMLTPQAPPIAQTLLDKHFLRKHGPGAYYGQGKKE